jgi:competence protein ComEC
MLGKTISFILGIASFALFPFFPASIIVFSIAISKGIFISGKDLKNAVFIIFVFIFGFFYSFIRQETFPEIGFTDKEASVEGNIVDVPEMINGKTRFTIDQVFINGKELKGKVRLSLSGGTTINKDFIVESGNRINAVTKLRALDVLHNPGIQSYDLKRDGIVAVGYSKEIHAIGKNKNLWIWIQNRRHLIGKLLDNSLSTEDAALHKAIIIGLKGGINREMRDAFSAAGLAHILSISGTHFGLLAFMIFKFIKMIVKCLPENSLRRMTLHISPSQIAVLITLPLLAFYALLSGMSTPAVRSLIVIFIYMLAIFLGRRDQWLNSLAIAAFIILLYKPSALFDISFQLSFMAVLSIGYVAESRARERGQGSKVRGQDKRNEHPIKKAFDKIKGAALMTVAAVAGTAPIMALTFKQFPVISPITNLIITPFICFIILPFGFIASSCALIFNMTSIPFNGLIDMVTHFSLQIIKIFSLIPYSNLHIPNPSFVMIILYYFSLIFMVRASCKKFSVKREDDLNRHSHEGGNPEGKAKTWIPAFAGMTEIILHSKHTIFRYIPFILIISIYLITTSFRGDKLKITFLDVGQGDSSVVELPDKKVMLIDGGMLEPDMGRAVIASYLWSRGVSGIDYLVLTHPHPDHYGGLIYIMENFRIGEVWLNGRKTAEADTFFQEIKEKKIYYRVLSRGDVLETDKYKIYVFHPYDEFFADSRRGAFSSENSASMVLKYESDAISALFTGDIETEAEESLTPLGKLLKSDIIKVPHHGGRTSSSAGLIKAVDPQIAVISAGRNNPFNHPHRETIERYKAAGVSIYRTDIDGAVTVVTQDKSFEVQTYWDNEFKKVSTWRDELRNLKLLF